MADLIEQARPLLDFIAKPESGGDYDIVWGGIGKADRPEARTGNRLTQMTVGEVLAWQDSIDSRYMSEAAGRYQIMEDTLRDLYRSAGMSTSSRFDREGQDRLAYALLVRRGLLLYLNGTLSAEGFANKLAREWASLPVVSGPKMGRSFYAGDGLNKSHVKVEPFLDCIRSLRTAPPMPKPPAPDEPFIRPDVEPAPAKTGLFAIIATFLAAIFTRKGA